MKATIDYIEEKVNSARDFLDRRMHSCAHDDLRDIRKAYKDLWNEFKGTEYRGEVMAYGTSLVRETSKLRKLINLQISKRKAA